MSLTSWVIPVGILVFLVVLGHRVDCEGHQNRGQHHFCHVLSVITY